MKIRIIILSLLLLSLVGCKKENSEEVSYGIGFVTDSEDINNNTRSGKISKVLNTIIENQNNAKLYEKISSSNNDYISNIENMINNDAKLIITNSFLLKDAVETLASVNNEVNFLAFDTVIDPQIDNVKTVNFKVNESSFLVGYLAGLETKSNIIGYVGYNSNLLSDLYEYGFRAGVLEASKELKKEISIHTKKVNTLSDFNNGKKLGDEMYDNGVDIIYQTVGLTGLGIIESAQNKGKLVIGYDMDQSYLAPENVLISSIKRYDKQIADIVPDYINNSEVKGGNLFLGLKEEAVGITDYSEESIYSIDNDKKLRQKITKLIDGEIEVPIDEESWNLYLGRE